MLNENNNDIIKIIVTLHLPAKGARPGERGGWKVTSARRGDGHRSGRLPWRIGAVGDGLSHYGSVYWPIDHLHAYINV